MSRPFGVALLIAGCYLSCFPFIFESLFLSSHDLFLLPSPGVDEHGPRLYQTDPSGTFSRYDAKAIGSGSEGAQTNLQDQYNKSMTMAEAQLLALSTLKQVMEEKISSSNVEIAVVTAAEKQFRLLSVAELDAIVAQLP